MTAKNALENRLVRKDTLHFEAIARRNKELGLWIAIMKGLNVRFTSIPVIRWLATNFRSGST